MMRKLMVGVWMMVAGTCLAQQVDLKVLDKFAAKAQSKNEIDMNEALLKSAAGFLDDKKASEGLARATSRNLKGIFVRSYEFDQKGAYTMDDLKPLLDQLKAPDWNRFIRSEEDGERTEIWMHSTKGVPDGLLIVSGEDKELSVVNLVGSTNLGDLGLLGLLGNIGAIAEANANNSANTAAGKKD
jgi:Domain of unknown function (DUF4252)